MLCLSGKALKAVERMTEDDENSERRTYTSLMTELVDVFGTSAGNGTGNGLSMKKHSTSIVNIEQKMLTTIVNQPPIDGPIAFAHVYPQFI